MKRIKFLPVLLLLSVFFVACDPQSQEKEWKKLYGYTTEDIAGTYAFSNIASAFDGLTEGKYCHICEDAKITITASSGNTIEFRLNCPNESLNRLFEGRPRVTDDDFLINMKAPASSTYPDYELTVYVYENDEGDIRLHGFARYIVYELVYNPVTEENDHIVKSKTNYYFDVIKN